MAKKIKKDILEKAYRLICTARSLSSIYEENKEITSKYVHATSKGHEVIQIAPLAFMRGRTLDNAFVILDEGQNTTHSQMKMFLTRMGKNAKFIITGDPGQVDLPRNAISGIKEAILILKNTPGVGIVHLDESDVIRNKLVKKIVDAYKNIENNS